MSDNNPEHCPYVMLPIARLPDELLSKTFCMSQDYWDSIQIAVRLSHTCRAWRRVALDTPRLWDVLRFGPTAPECALKQIEMQITRTKAAPLDIFLNLPSDLACPQAILDNIHRSHRFVHTRRGRYSSTEHAIDATFQPYFLQPAPFLESLEIDRGYADFCVNFGYASKLQKVSLYGPFNWGKTAFKGSPLISLHFQSPMSMEWLHIALDSPCLEELQVTGWVAPFHLHEALDSSSAKETFNVDGIKPKQLMKLSLETLSSAAATMSLIHTFRPSASLTIGMISYKWSDESMTAVMSTLFPLASHRDLKIYSQLHRHHITLAATESSLSQDAKPNHISLHGGGSDVAMLLLVVPGVRQLRLLYRLSIDVQQTRPDRDEQTFIPDTETWRRLFLSLPVLKSLTVLFEKYEHEIIGPFFQAFGPDADPAMLPQLQELIFDARGWRDPVIIDVIRPLFGWLERRFVMGCPIFRLIERSGGIFDAEQIDELKRYGCAVVTEGETS